MQILIKILIGIIAFEHMYIMYFEMFAWETIGKRSFRNFPKDLFKPTKPLAANQGLYNGFLAAGLIWSLLICDVSWSENIGLFFLSCISAAGIYGGLTVSKKIFFVQALPALITLGLILVQKV